MSLDIDYRREYDALAHALAEQAVGTRFCSDCQAANILDLFNPFGTGGRPPHPRKILRFDSLTDFTGRSTCPVCRFLLRVIRDGNKNCCAASCQSAIHTLQDGQTMTRDSTSTEEKLQIELWLPQEWGLGWIRTRINGQNVDRHISFGGLRFVHPKYADHQRIKAWLKTCREGHQSCNEQQSISSRGLHGLSPSCLRLIDVKSRLIVQTRHCVPFITLSYVWGEAASRTFEEKAMESESYHASDKVCRMYRQPIALLEENLPQTFEDAISFTKRLGERYIWIDALCIPQDEPDIKAQQISQMDQIYSSSVCTIASLESGVTGGLPGASYESPRNVDQYLEQLPGGLRIASPLMNLRLLMEESPWETRAWTMQEHLLSRRTLFLGKQQVFFICGEMTTKESWVQPHTKAYELDADLESLDEWAEYCLPLPTATPRHSLQQSYQTCASLYSDRNLTFPSDRFRAFEGLQARLSKLYQVDFIHAMPIGDVNFLGALLWRHSSTNPTLIRDLNSPSSTLRQWPHWTWLSHPGGVDYDPFFSWGHRRSYAKYLKLPHPKAWYQGLNGQFYSFTSTPTLDNSDRNSPLRSVAELSTVRVLKLSGLALDIDITKWCRRQGMYPSLEVWRNPNFSTARGSISFHIGMVVDDQHDGRFNLPEGTRYIRLLRLNPRDRPKMPWSLIRNKPYQVLKPQATLNDSSQLVLTTNENGPRAETEFSSALDWISRSDGLDEIEADSALLVVGVTPSGIVTRRLGIAYVRMIDFLVAGAVQKEVLLGD
ncbi:heterokaryon incompatibility protein (het) domain-containing protein [Fusarium flagelliforme]|uniref:Heterokaryon incompatibility protein (Het) domain-containing protein n=2 Tax=Fusarium flagelliforme TaxID=2675880 RepID=A0A395MMZ5_9HYPO|nr:heterokaryon incompatibility protein (het) domain-containing protein [Fusarium flagelliforme]